MLHVTRPSLNCDVILSGIVTAVPWFKDLDLLSMLMSVVQLQLPLV